MNLISEWDHHFQSKKRGGWYLISAEQSYFHPYLLFPAAHCVSLFLFSSTSKRYVSKLGQDFQVVTYLNPYLHQNFLYEEKEIKNYVLIWRT